LLAVLLFTVLGSFMLPQSRAATDSISSEPESGTISDGAAKITDSTASGGSAVKFGSNAAPVTPTGLLAFTGGDSVALV
jgi:hypothetical protein